MVKGGPYILWGQFVCTAIVVACRGAASSRPDAGRPPPPEVDAGEPSASFDAGSEDDELRDAGDNPNPIPDQPDAQAPLVTRRLCGVANGVVTLEFPSGDILSSFAYDRVLGQVHAVDPVHEEMYVGTRLANGLQVFSTSDSGDASPLRTLTSASGAYVHAAALDTSNDTLIVAVGRSIATYSRTASGSAQPLRRVQLPAGPFAPLSLAVDVSGERILIVDPTNVYAYSLTASHPAEPIEVLDSSCTSVAVSPTRGEVHLACSVTFDSSEIRTWPLGVSLAQAPARTLVASFGLGPILTDELNGEIYVGSENLPVFDIDADGPSDPLATLSLTGGSGALLQYKGLHPAQNELFLQGPGGGSIEVYARPLSPSATPTRVLVEGEFGSVNLVAFDGTAGELYLHEETGTSTSVNVYPVDATGSDPATPIRRLLSSTGGFYGRVAFAQGSKELFAGGPSPASPRGVFDGTQTGELSPLRSFPPDLAWVLPDSAHGELLAITGTFVSDTRFVAFDIDAGEGAAPLRELALASPRPWLDDPQYGTRAWRILDAELDTIRDRVLLAVADCFEWGTKSGGGSEDCHFDIWSFPRTASAGTAISSFEVPVDVDAERIYQARFEIAFDGRNDLILAHVVQFADGVVAPRFFRADSSEVRALRDWPDLDLSDLLYCD